MLSETLKEDLMANALLGAILVGLACCKDLCKRISHSDCVLDRENGLSIKLPTWHADEPDPEI